MELLETNSVLSNFVGKTVPHCIAGCFRPDDPGRKLYLHKYTAVSCSIGKRMQNSHTIALCNRLGDANSAAAAEESHVVPNVIGAVRFEFGKA